MKAHISQREARRLKKRVYELESQEERRRRSWSQDWFGGVEICRAEWSFNDAVPTALRTAHRLTHAVVAVCEYNNGNVRFMALPVGKS